jgi:uncharacterized protein YndB with AHSA1/START domain
VCGRAVAPAPDGYPPSTHTTEEETVADHVAVAETEIDAPPERVWTALTNPKQIEKYMFGSKVETDWQPGSRIVWKGEYEGRKYEDHGEILEADPGHRLELTHFSPLGGREDAPENYHTIVYELEQHSGGTRVRLSQDNNPTREQADRSRSTWEQMLAGLKEVVEKG